MKVFEPWECKVGRARVAEAVDAIEFEASDGGAVLPELGAVSEVVWEG